MTYNNAGGQVGSREQECLCLDLALQIFHLKAKLGRETSHRGQPQHEASSQSNPDGKEQILM